MLKKGIEETKNLNSIILFLKEVAKSKISTEGFPVL